MLMRIKQLKLHFVNVSELVHYVSVMIVIIELINFNQLVDYKRNLKDSTRDIIEVEPLQIQQACTRNEACVFQHRKTDIQLKSTRTH